jgi:hypothetical protein
MQQRFSCAEMPHEQGAIRIVASVDLRKHEVAFDVLRKGCRQRGREGGDEEQALVLDIGKAEALDV